MNKTCFRYASGQVGYPWIAPLDREHCVVADGTGHLTSVNLVKRQAEARVFVGAMDGLACCNLRSLCVRPGAPTTVAVATCGGYAVVCDVARQVVARNYPRLGGTVNCVAFSSDGRFLVIGTGFYSLSADWQEAHVELWTLEETEPEFLAVATLPGVCVDAITWSPDADSIACASGMRSQKQQFVAQVHPWTLRTGSFFETAWTNLRRLTYMNLEDTCSHVAVVTTGALRVLNSATGVEKWRVEETQVSSLPIDFDYAAKDVIVLTSGVVVDAIDRQQRDSFLFMNDCTAIACRPGGGYLGASSRGRICFWE